MRYFLHIARACALVYAAAAFAFADGADGLTRFEANAPVNDFSLPMFGDGGYKIWHLSGERGRYVSRERIDIEKLRLRLFSGDERSRVDVTIESPSAVVNPSTATASGADFLYVHGPGYSVTGRGWAWDDRAKSLKILSDVEVTFSARGERADPVLVSAKTLDIETRKDDYYFRFSGDVRVLNGDLQMRTPRLYAWSNREERAGETDRLRSVRRILADEGVDLSQGGRRLTARRAELPEEGHGREIVMTDDAVMRDESNDAVLYGDEVRLWRDTRRVLVSPKKEGRVRASLPPSGGDGARRMEITGARMEADAAENGSRTLAFFGSVRVDDPAFNVACDTLSARFGRGEAARAEEIVATGNVAVEQASRRAFAPEGRIFPDKSEAELSGGVTVADSDSGAIVEGARLTLSEKTGNAVVFGEENAPVRVTLAPLEGAPTTEPTRIYGDSVRLARGDVCDVISFLGGVRVDSGAFALSCGNLDAFVAHATASSPAASPTREFGNILRIEGRENVRYSQEGMSGEAARIEVFPRATFAEDGGEAAAARFVSLYGDAEGKKGSVRPVVCLPPFSGEMPLDAGAAGASAAAPEKTRIESDEQELFMRADGSRFYFRGNVDVRGGGFEMACDEIEVVSVAPEGAQGGARNVGTPERVLANGNIVFKQGTRTATGGEAEFWLGTGKCVLGGSPVVADSADGTRVNGWRITFLRGQKRLFIEGAPPAGGNADGSAGKRRRPTVVLPPLGDMGFDTPAKTQDKGKL